MGKWKVWMGVGSAVLLVAALSAVSITIADAQPATTQAAAEPARDGVFVHISHGPDDPHRVLMGLQMANMMAADKDVLVYFDVKGIELVLKDAEDVSFAQFPALSKQLETLPEKGVTLMACPGCLKAMDKSAEDLAEGVQVAEKDAFFDFTDGRILTLDY